MKVQLFEYSFFFTLLLVFSIFNNVRLIFVELFLFTNTVMSKSHHKSQTSLHSVTSQLICVTTWNIGPATQSCIPWKKKTFLHLKFFPLYKLENYVTHIAEAVYKLTDI